MKDHEGKIKNSAKKVIQTSDGPRFIDNLLNGVAREIKSGYLALNSDIKKQIIRDLLILKAQIQGIDKIEWHILGGIDDKVIEFARNEMMTRSISTELFKFII